MRPDLGELALVEETGLAEHLRADVDLSDVVERRPEPKRLDPLLVPPEATRHGLRIRADACGVRGEGRVAHVHCGRKGGETNHGNLVPVARREPFPYFSR